MVRGIIALAANRNADGIFLKEAAMPELLSRRVLALQLDKNEIARVEPDTLRELQRRCALCESQEECELGLADDFADVGWNAYCPNAAMLNTLGELPWFRRGPV
jgi:hypothetical protein